MEDKLLLSEELISDFIRDGYIVVPNVFSSTEVQNFRDDFHQRMLELGFDHSNMSEQNYANMPRFGMQTEIFYPDFKFAIHEDPRFFQIISQLWGATYAEGIAGFENPFVGFNADRGYMYIDRACCRLPDSIKPQGGLGLHVDCDPLNAFDDSIKWRPIQASIALTDSLTNSSGGLYVVPRMHKCMEDYVRVNNDNEEDTSGKCTKKGKSIKSIKCKSFTRLDHCEDLVQGMVPVFAPAGSIVIWDNRLPHATAEKHDGPDTREVLFMTFLPDIHANKLYAKEQRENYFKRKAPPDFINKRNRKDVQEEPNYQFTELGRRLMAMDEW